MASNIEKMTLISILMTISFLFNVITFTWWIFRWQHKRLTLCTIIKKEVTKKYKKLRYIKNVLIIMEDLKI